MAASMSSVRGITGARPSLRSVQAAKVTCGSHSVSYSSVEVACVSADPCFHQDNSKQGSTMPLVQSTGN